MLIGHCYETFSDLPYAPVARAIGEVLPGLDINGLCLPDAWLAEAARLVAWWVNISRLGLDGNPLQP